MNHQNKKKKRIIDACALIIYGGGLCDNAAQFITETAELLRKKGIFQRVFVGRYSFRCLTEDEALIKEWSEVSPNVYKNVLGGFFGTCRETDLASDDQARNRAIARCKSLNIKYIFLGGGDGTARQMSEVAEAFQKEGINFVFTLPLTIDGIEGGASIGLESAVKASLARINEVSSTGLRTLDGNKYPALAIKLMGRNRDNILAEVIADIDVHGIKDFSRDEVEICAIPANYEWSDENLTQILAIEDNPNAGKLLGKPVLILYSEGAKLNDVQLEKTDLKMMAKKAGRKLRFYSIGHNSQINNATSHNDRMGIHAIIKMVVDAAVDNIIAMNDNNKEMPFSVVWDVKTVRIEGFDYFARKNPRTGQKPKLKKKMETTLKKYIP